MNRIVRIFPVILLAAVIWPGCGGRMSRYKILPVPLLAQETRMWCWAACGEMITAYYGKGERGKGVSQVVQANNRFMRKDCSGKTIRWACIKGGHPEFEKYGLTYPQKQYGALSWQELAAQLDMGSPVAFSWEWKACKRGRAYGSHYMVARGYVEIGGIKMVLVNDPLPVSRDNRGGTVSLVAYADYVRFCPRYIHAYSLFGIGPEGEQKGENPPGRSPPLPDLPDGIADGPGEAAQESLELLKSLPTPVLQAMGIDPQVLTGECILGEPVGATKSGSRRMKRMIPGMGPPVDAMEVHYAVNAGETPVTTVTVRKRDGQWALAVFADTNALLAALALREMPLPRGEPDHFILQILPLNMTFLAYYQEDEDRLYLVPTTADPDLELKPHRPVPAETVFEELKYLLKRWVNEENNDILNNRLAGAWKAMDRAIRDLESGEREQVLWGMDNVVKTISEMLSQLREEDGRL